VIDQRLHDGGTAAEEKSEVENSGHGSDEIGAR